MTLGTALLLVAVASLPATAEEEEAPTAAAKAADAKADDKPEADAKDDAKTEAAKKVVERVRVVGSPEKARDTPGSVTYLGKKLLAEQRYSDVQRALRRVPGINIQEEDGYGLRPNIGMRGSGVERSSRITLMEDGVLVAPAPYSAPSAYYFPSAYRMEGLEVRKGSASIRQGPFTTGGVLNMVSTSIPNQSLGGTVDVAAGTNSTGRGRFNIGGSGDRFGWLIETFQMRTDGFKRLDTGGDTGFELEDYMGKFRVTSRPDARRFQALELKLGKTTQNGDETYLGLTQPDFDADPFRRYAGSQLDNIDTDHEQIQLRYFARPTEKLDVTATVYNNDFYRNWYKLQSVEGTSISNILDRPENFQGELDIIRADLAADSPDGALAVRANRRNYYGRGVQAVLGIDVGERTRHDIEVGVRYHRDEEDRFQEEDDYKMTSGAQMLLTTPGIPGSQSNRVSSAEALSLFVQDTIDVGRFTVVPGVRFESIDFKRVDYADPERTTIGGERRSSIDEVIPGVGANYRIDPSSSVFLGIHRGFAPPSPSNNIADAEESVNYELGYRYGKRQARAEAIGFFNDYENLLGTCTASSGCTTGDIGDQYNGGEARTWGLELSGGYDINRQGSVRFPIDLVYTYTRTEFLNAFESDYDPWGDIEAGDEFPYVPRHQGTLSLGAVARKWSAYGSVVYVDRMRTQGGQGAIPADQGTDSATLLELTVNYFIKPEFRIFAQGRNLTDEAYVAARRPSGARPGLNRTILVGLGFDF